MKDNTLNNRFTPNILMVDDVGTNLKLLDDILNPEGYKTRPVPNGELALIAAEKEKPDLILLDIMMPGIDGFEICRRLKENPGLSDIPIIFISALGDTDNIVKALTAGGVDYINKPFQAEEVKARVRTHLKLHRQSKELRELNATKDKFFSIIAHDLRGPFSGFLGLSKLLAEELPGLTQKEIQKMSGSMRDSATNLFNLLENLLEWSRMQQGGIIFNPESIWLMSIMNDSMSPVMDSADKKGVEIRYEIHADLEVFADAYMLASTIRNLASNAVKFTRKGGKITIAAKTVPGNLVEFSVRDTGIGMNPEMVADLFRIDVQNNRRGTENEPSSGLGLLLSKDFVEKHQGQIWVDSEEEKGSTFYFTLPGDPRVRSFEAMTEQGHLMA